MDFTFTLRLLCRLWLLFWGAGSLHAAFCDGVCNESEPISCWDLCYHTCWHGGYEAHGALLIVRPTICDTMLAVRDLRRIDTASGWGLASLPDGCLDSIKPRFEVGFQVGVGAVLNDRRNDVQLTYTGLFMRDRRYVVPPDIQGLWPLIGHPRYLNLRLNNALITGVPVDGALDAFADGKVGVDYNTLDAHVAARFCTSSGVFVRPFLGMRWLLMSFAQHTHYEGTAAFSAEPGFSSQRHRHRSTAKSWGVGPRIGLQMRIPIWFGFGLMGQLAGALLGGEANLVVKEHHEITVLMGQGNDVEQRLEIRRSGCQLIPELDERIGLSYFRVFGDTFYLDVQAGWVGISYLSAVATVRFNDRAGTSYTQGRSFGVGGVFLSVRIGV